jgi:hypothetical protein
MSDPELDKGIHQLLSCMLGPDKILFNRGSVIGMIFGATLPVSKRSYQNHSEIRLPMKSHATRNADDEIRNSLLSMFVQHHWSNSSCVYAHCSNTV